LARKSLNSGDQFLGYWSVGGGLAGIKKITLKEAISKSGGFCSASSIHPIARLQISAL